MQQCPRHFRLSKGVLQALATYALPAAGVWWVGEREGGTPRFQHWHFARHAMQCCDAARGAALLCPASLPPLRCSLPAARPPLLQ